MCRKKSLEGKIEQARFSWQYDFLIIHVHNNMLFLACTFSNCVSIRRQIVEENRYLDEKENIRQRSAERYQIFSSCIIMCQLLVHTSTSYTYIVIP